MKTAEEILSKWYKPLHGVPLLAELQIIEAMKEYAIEVAKRTQINCADNVQMEKVKYTDDYIPCRESILDENNIPTL